MGRMRHMPWSALPHWVAGSHGSEGLVRVGVVMKSERHQELCTRSLLPMTPTDGIVFVPLDMHQPLAGQQPYDALLHKVNGHPMRVYTCWQVCTMLTSPRPPCVPLSLRLGQRLMNTHILWGVCYMQHDACVHLHARKRGIRAGSQDPCLDTW